MINESENENLLKLSINKEYSIISNIEDILSENVSQISNNIEKNIIKKFLSDKNSKNLTKKEKCLHILEILSKFKLFINHNCAKETFYKYISSFLVDDADCHLVATFKENLLNDYIDEFLRRIYKIKESKERIPKFSKYYKNYLQFFCKPTFRSFPINKIIDKNGERKAEIYYKNNYQGGKSKTDDENNGFAKSSSSEEDINKKKNKLNNNNIENINNLVQLFDDSLKEKIENVTIMTTINSSINNTLNLKLDNEKIEVFSENKCDKSNDTTLHDIMKIIKIQKNKNNKNLSKLKKELIQPLKEKSEKEIKNNSSYKNIKIKEDTNNNNIINKNNSKNQNLKNNGFLKLNEKIMLNVLDKDAKDKIKKIIQNVHMNKGINKKLKDKETKKEIKISVSPLSLSNNKNYMNNNSDILVLKKNENANTHKNKSNIKRSRNNNIGFLYKQSYTNYNNYNNLNQNNNIFFKTNKFNSTTLHKANKNINYNNNLLSILNNNNFPLKLNSKINNNIMPKNNLNNNNSKYYITNSSSDNKATSMKMLEGYTSYINKNELKNKNQIKLYQDNLIYKLKKQNHNNFLNNNYDINKLAVSSNKIYNTDLITQENNNISEKRYQHQNYNSLSKKIKSKPSLSNKKQHKSLDPTHTIGNILFDSNSSTSNKTFNKNFTNLANNIKNINYSKIINNNFLHLNNNYLKEVKKYNNNNNGKNNYNININNQIIINTNLNNYSYNTNLKEFMNNNSSKQDYGYFNLYKNKNISKNSKKNPAPHDMLGINNNNFKKYKTRNTNSGLKKYYSNPNDENEISPKNIIGNVNNKIMKSIHNKKGSNISNLFNDNKKMLFLKKRSKNKNNKI